MTIDPIWPAARADHTPADRRAVRRRRVLKGARVENAAHLLMLDVAVRNISPTGAGLRLGDLAVLPPQFSLTLNEGGAARACERVWTRGTDAGVRFA